MNGNDFIHWLSALGEGGWDAFRQGVRELAGGAIQENEAELLRLAATARFRLSEEGSVEFSKDGRKRWRVLPPVLASLPEDPGSAALCGGRCPGLLMRLRSAAEACRCRVETKPREALPDRVGVAGAPEALDAVAAAAGIGRSRNFAGEMAGGFVPVDALLARAPAAEPMTGWRRRWFDLASRRWTDRELPRAVCEYTPQHGPGVVLLPVSRRRTVKLPRREALYAAASLAGASLLSYDAASETLRAPMHAPLPEGCARLACISSGSFGQVEDGCVCYRPVPLRVAGLILACLGQSRG